MTDNPAAQRRRYAANLPKYRRFSLQSRLKARYGITIEDRDAMLLAQGNSCKICHTKTPSTKNAWHVDHCHRTGTVRGILCQHCNMMLGNAKDNPETLASAISYLLAG